MFAGSKKYNPDPRTTDDKFLMEICEENDKEIKKIQALMKETGAVESQIGDYKVKKRKSSISFKKYFEQKLDGMFGFLKRKKK